MVYVSICIGLSRATMLGTEKGGKYLFAPWGSSPSD